MHFSLGDLIYLIFCWCEYESLEQDNLSLSIKVRDGQVGLADIISMHAMVTNQILLFNFETVAKTGFSI